ncbi:MAG: acireductone synthase [Acidobacteriota bacterium]|nr:acireductone synthase [Acidobacteriota bacterium]
MEAILLDIEGTTTPIDFVHQTLFPFARRRMAKFVEENFSLLTDEIKSLKTEHEEDYVKEFDGNAPASIADYLKFLIDEDRKSTALKSVQGKIWRIGYESGELKSEVFADVPRAFTRWREQGKTIAIYSSGSVLAQKLIFRHSNCGDLTAFIADYFDTNVGGKKEPASYRKIAAAINFPAAEIAFVSDLEAELDAAKAAGLKTVLSIRKGNAPLDKQMSHLTVKSFDEME